MAAKSRSSSDVLNALNELFHPKQDEEDPDHPKTPPYVYHDADYLRNLLEEARILISKVLQESIDLTESTNKFKDEAFEIQEMQTKDIQEKRERIEELEALCTKKDEDMVKQKADAAQELFEASQRLKIINRRLQDTLGKRIEELQTLLTGVQDFRDRQVEVEGRMAAAEEYASKTKAEMERMLPDLERNFLEKCSQHEKEFERKLEELKEQLTAEVEERVGERMRNILADNEQLIKDVRVHVGATDELTELKDEFQAKSTTLAMEVGLLKASEALHVKRGSVQHHLVESHASKVAMLEKSLRQIIRQYSNERAQLENSHTEVLLGLEAEKTVLRNLVLAKTKELKRLRHLAQHVVNQRCDVENFLIESLEYIREQLAAARSGKSKYADDRRMRDDSSSESSGFLPSIKSTPRSMPGAPSCKSSQKTSKADRNFNGRLDNLKSNFHQHDEFIKQLHEVDGPDQLDLSEDFSHEVPRITPKVDISDLSWCDREKVLRYLFQKINQVHQPGTVLGDSESGFKGGKSCRNIPHGFSTAPYTISGAGKLLC
ncbi:hypothetical protein MPTK1_4g12890 [Marchantia polymorpha subsp. ruderalis]|uniref:Uncharacterized protein n=2 Tax=Marchantia polymorpha TaxID=3197 RepID=A0A176VLR5_MARPO|nr:hypothetical protein AXG93_138s1110 [Marchantia polymorpha subsp. ruderalis]PTQ29591.1 hypothetical protein MARPO_0138s0027 [Marchantia polymorpha]BBN08603.1 hypothetical protein Mp_4g12890 [Marchantia polymorpha subsp. ruderalis]|eukprot:PTQ29591.1 hypothetical protein MARPO_0138s0027 [Marchantia polymorpha]